MSSLSIRCASRSTSKVSRVSAFIVTLGFFLVNSSFAEGLPEESPIKSLEGWSEVRFGSGCQSNGWCFRSFSDGSLTIVEVPLSPDESHFEVLSGSDQSGGYGLSCETIPQSASTRSVINCEDEPYFSNCGWQLQINCFEIHDAGDYSVIIVYGGVPGSPADVILGPPVEGDEEEDDSGEEDGE